MNRLFSARTLAVAAVALGAAGAASVAHARSDVVFSIGFGAPIGYAHPPTVYMPPAPVYVQPAPVYYGHTYHGRHYGHHYRPYADYDRDGIPNRYDRHPYRPDGRIGNDWGWHDSDRDGVPNRYDQRPHNPYRY